MSRRKPGIFIPDLYLYHIKKIQADIDKQCINKLSENHIFKYMFEENFLNGPDSTQRKMGRNQPKNKMGLLSIGLDSAQPKPHDWLLFTVQ